MARCRVFVSSTFYDLKYIRSALEQFIIQMGYDPVLFEKGDIAFSHDQALEESCYHEIELSDIFVLVIGGRYGAISQTHGQQEQDDNDAISKFKSITEREYEQARIKDIPIYIFVEAGVYSEYRTFQKNRDKDINYAFVDDKRIFELIESIFKERRNNLVKEFHRAEDITNWLRDQWSGVFSDLMRNKTQGQRIAELQNQVAELSSIVNSLRSYSEQIIKAVGGSNAENIIKQENKKLTNDLISISASQRRLTNYTASKPGAKVTSPEEITAIIELSKDYEDFVEHVTDDEGARRNFLRWESGSGPRRDYDRMKEFLASEDTEKPTATKRAKPTTRKENDS